MWLNPHETFSDLSKEKFLLTVACCCFHIYFIWFAINNELILEWYGVRITYEKIDLNW